MKFCYVLIFLSTAVCGQDLLVPDARISLRRKILESATFIFNTYEVSYVYGGNKVGSQNECEACNSCLQDMKPSSRERVQRCPACQACSLDCSHFIQVVFARAGVTIPYLTTEEMLTYSPLKLMNTYGLVDLGTDTRLVATGDFLVYKGHVVLVTVNRGNGKADIIHATGGRDIKEPGQGIQVERFIAMSTFRGPLLKVLRHKQLVNSSGPKSLTRKVEKSP